MELLSIANQINESVYEVESAEEELVKIGVEERNNKRKLKKLKKKLAQAEAGADGPEEAVEKLKADVAVLTVGVEGLKTKREKFMVEIQKSNDLVVTSCEEKES